MNSPLFYVYVGIVIVLAAFVFLTGYVAGRTRGQEDRLTEMDADDPDYSMVLARVLRNLLADTQHKDHHCADFTCPVQSARDALSAYEERCGRVG